MRRSPLSFETVSIAFAPGTLHSAVIPNLDHPEFSSVRVIKMAREARTVPQYKILANFYEARRRMYIGKAAEQMRVWTIRSAGATGASGPSLNDSARNLYEYYLRQAAKSAVMCARYTRLAHLADSQDSCRFSPTLQAITTVGAPASL
jgi:hypothetical protein